MSTQPTNPDPLARTPSPTITRRRFLQSSAATAALLALPSFVRSDPTTSPAPPRTRPYGFLSSAILHPQSDDEARLRVRTMARDFGIREFQFYDWFADYSTPTRGDTWTDPYFRRHPISLRTIQVSLDQIHQEGGRAWAYIQSVAAEEQDLADPAADIYKIIDSAGRWYWHPMSSPNPRFPTYLPNAAWARHMVNRWAEPVKNLGFDGIHWDTLGRIADHYPSETAAIHAFIRTAHTLLQPLGLKQTLNFVDLAWWDRALVRDHLEFAYAETWSNDTADRYFTEMAHPDLSAKGGVWAMYPTTAVPAGQTATDLIRTRHERARRHGLSYLIVGDGARRMQKEYWPDTLPLTAPEATLLRPTP